MPAEKNRRVLVIDDNRAIHDDFRKILSPATAAAAALDATEEAVFGPSTDATQQTQFDVDSAYQGQEGVLRVKKALEAGLPYAMAFVDVRMPPGWDGVETTWKIWEIDPNLQVVLCTAYSDYSWGEMFEKLGHRDGLLILKKPFDAVEALQLAHALTEKWWLHRQSLRKMEELESRVSERTRELRKTNDALEIEVIKHKRAEKQLNIQYAISRVLAESSTAEQATPKILQVLGDNSGWDASELWSVDSREGVLRCVGIWSAPNILMDEFKAASRQMTFAPNVGLPGRVWASGQPAWIADVVQDGNFPRALAAKQAGLHAAFAFPILMGSGVSGVLEIFSREVREPDEGWLNTFAVLGSQLGQFFQRRRLEDQLFQSQKLETVGKLAGGVAHEFNSILTAIIGHSELLLGDLPAGSPLAQNAAEISEAAGRAATLTRQLLAYGRKQMLQPEILDLNAVIASMGGVLRQLMGGEAVEVNIVPAVGLHWVKADAGQIEQVVMNIAINARDAMPKGGKLTLETANVSFHQASVGRDPELKPGDYVMLAITDTGAGMSEEVRARVFEPFFTTKGVGQGTGLGLSTCYGIIKQSGGHISVNSEPACGATLKIYLPQVERQTKIPIQRLDSPDLPRGTETILLVEDDPALREMGATLLRRLGYTVLAAANGIEALSLKPPRDIGHIDLLFTDVVMRQTSGKELADRVRVLYPHIRILFTSAYTGNAIAHQGVWNEGVALLQKPFTPSALARKVREALDQPSAPKSGLSAGEI